MFTSNTQPRPGGFEIASGSGLEVIDVDGNRYLDLCGQTLNVNLGQCHPQLVDAATAELQNLTYVSSRFATTGVIELAQKLMTLTPPELTHVNLKCLSGSDANECAIKAARKRAGKPVIFALKHSHHGQTTEMMRISGKHFDKPWIPKTDVQHFEPPYCYRCPFGKQPESCNTECLDEVEVELHRKSDQVAAMIVEPIMVDAGVIVPPTKYLTRLREITAAADVSLIFDEIQTAFGWLGEFFAMDYFGVIPDALTIGKGFGGGYPLAAALFRESHDTLEYGEHELTYGANPVAVAASRQMIEVLQDGMLDEAKARGKVLHEALTDLSRSFDQIGDVRGVGLLWGIEFVDESGDRDSTAARAFLDRMLTAGFLLRVSKVGDNSNIIQLKPALIITDDVIQQFYEAARDALAVAG